jgi:type III pantothenate kinase
MLLCLDIGNSHIFGGVFKHNEITLRFRHNTAHGSTSDQLGIFLKNVLKENGLGKADIAAIAICSVVPSIDYTMRAACKKYFNLEPFILRAGIKTGIKIKTNNPTEVGADLIAGAIAANHYYSKQNVIVIDLGTATTLAAISCNKEYLGTAILPGIKTSINALHNAAEKLYPVEIIKPANAAGKYTAESIQSGIYHGHLGAIKEISTLMTKELFPKENPILIGTGGFSQLFTQENIFDVILPDLILDGLRIAFNFNNKE